MSRCQRLAFAMLLLVVPSVPAGDLTTTIDREITARLAARGIRPAPRADDAEYLRRVFLDLAGRIPSVDEARAFLADTSPDKRTQVVDRLLAGPRHVEHFANVWRRLLVPEQAANVDAQLRSDGGFDGWLRRQIAENVPYDRFARDVLTVPFAAERVRGSRAAAMRRPDEVTTSDATPAAFYTAKEAKPENLAASTARVFLGVRIECAQCHDHPQGHWTRAQFWSYAAFFAGLSRSSDSTSGVREVFDKREMTIPGSSTVVEAEFLDGAQPQWKFNVGSRVTLADWVTARDNPYFAKAAVNRLWAHFFGHGLVDPEDDLRADNPPSHPELLDALARDFVDHRFDIRYLIRAMMASEAYQRTSAAVGPDDDPRAFARMALKRLTPEQLFDSLAQATGFREPPPRRDPNVPVIAARDGARREFLNLFANGSASRTDVQLSIPQALLLMNGGFVADATRTGGGLLDAVLRALKLDTATGTGPTYLSSVVADSGRGTTAKVEALFLATLTRRPNDAESERLTRYVDGHASQDDRNIALANVFWALLNSAEFMVNH